MKFVLYRNIFVVPLKVAYHGAKNLFSDRMGQVYSLYILNTLDQDTWFDEE